jgi:hypothetical protein
MCVSAFLSFCLSVFICICLSFCFYVSLSLCLSVCLCFSVSLSFCLSLFLCLFVFLTFCLFVFLLFTLPHNLKYIKNYYRDPGPNLRSSVLQSLAFPTELSRLLYVINLNMLTNKTYYRRRCTDRIRLKYFNTNYTLFCITSRGVGIICSKFDCSTKSRIGCFFYLPYV